jgi:hypothetical protein
MYRAHSRGHQWQSFKKHVFIMEIKGSKIYQPYGSSRKALATVANANRRCQSFSFCGNDQVHYLAMPGGGGVRVVGGSGGNCKSGGGSGSDGGGNCNCGGGCGSGGGVRVVDGGGGNCSCGGGVGSGGSVVVLGGGCGNCSCGSGGDSGGGVVVVGGGCGNCGCGGGDSGGGAAAIIDGGVKVLVVSAMTFVGSEALPTPYSNVPLVDHVRMGEHLHLPPNVSDVQELDPGRRACSVISMKHRHKGWWRHDIHVLALRVQLDATQEKEDVHRPGLTPGNLHPPAVVNDSVATLEAHVERHYPSEREDGAPCNRNSVYA